MAKTYTTIIQALSPTTGSLTTWVGDRVVAENREEAQKTLNSTGRGYMNIAGELVEELECSSEGWKQIYESL